MKSGLKYILFAVSAVALVAVAVAAYRHLSSVTPAPSDPPTSATSPSSVDETVKPGASGKEKTARFHRNRRKRQECYAVGKFRQTRYSKLLGDLVSSLPKRTSRL